MTPRARLVAWVVGATVAVAAAAVPRAGQDQAASWRDDLSATRWHAAPATGVALKLATETSDTGPALRLDFDFQGHGGWAAARREIDLALPENWELRFRLRGEAPPNHLEIKLVDRTGENVWWSVRRDYAAPREWTVVRVKKRQVSFAWGPAGGGDLRHLGALEVAITAGAGGRGTIWFSDLELRALPPDRPYAGQPSAVATTELPGHAAGLAVDGRRDTAWRAGSMAGELVIDFGETREFGGLTFFWETGRAPRRLALDVASETGAWREVRRIERGGGARTDIPLPDAESRAVRLRVLEAPAGVGLEEVVVRPLAFGASDNALFEAIAAEAPRGTYPRGFSGEQVFWTLAGVEADTEEALVSEDGTIDLGAGAPSLEPFLWVDGRLWGWADVTSTQALVDGDLPIPIVTWDAAGVRLETTVLAVGAGQSGMLVRYRVRNTTGGRRAGRLFVAARPFQVNPPSQFLNRPGGVAALRNVRCRPDGIDLDERRVFAAPPASGCGAVTFDEGPIADWLARGEVPVSGSATDSIPRVSAALAWTLDLAPGADRTFVVSVPLHGADGASPGADGGAGADAAAHFDTRLAGERARWRERLDRVKLDVPPEAAAMADTVTSSLGWILVNRDGPAIQPGSRAYARSWIRDGALTSTALLRLGHTDEAREFAEWFARFQYDDGRVPCCVDARGADPVAEHDSHGEFVHLVAEVARFTGDRAFALRMLPHVERAAAAIDALRAQRRTPRFREPGFEAFHGLLPESISHEGYSAKPVHSYWDSGFAWLGLGDAAWLAGWLGHAELSGRFAASQAELGADLRASIERVRAARHLDYVPGSADLGDFDSTATTAMVDPVGLDALVPREWLVATFERYHAEFVARRNGRRAWDAYTPYEVRHIGAFVRLGWRTRAHELLRAFLDDRRPPAWNQFPEVVTRQVREPRFLGDLPHGWVASDFVRSVLDLFAYERRHDEVLVIAAGIPADWLGAGRQVGIAGLRTPYGPLTYDISAEPRALRMRVQPLARQPRGGIVVALPLPDGVRSVRVGDREILTAADGTFAIAALPAAIDVRVAW